MSDIEAFAQEIYRGIGLGFVEAQHNLALFNAVAVAHQDLADDSPLKMLHRLALAFDTHTAHGDRRALERRQGSPGTKAHEEQQDDGKAEPRRSRDPQRTVEHIVANGLPGRVHCAKGGRITGCLSHGSVVPCPGVPGRPRAVRGRLPEEPPHHADQMSESHLR